MRTSACFAVSISVVGLLRLPHLGAAFAPRTSALGHGNKTSRNAALFSSSSVQPSTQQHQNQDHPTTIQEEDDKATTETTIVSSTVEKVMSHTSPEKVKKVWLEHFWCRGGGLPVWVVLLEDQDEDKLDGIKTTRLLLPVGMKETLIKSEDPRMIRYQVVDAGPLLGQHVVAGSHAASVTFDPVGPHGCRMVWKNTFAVSKYPKFYNFLKDVTMRVAANTVTEAAATPRLFTLTAILPGIVSPDHAAREWLDFFWGHGGGLPLLPAIRIGDKIPGMDEESIARTTNLRVPPYLKETIHSIQWARNHVSDNVAEICYSVENPGWATVPFLLHTHSGRIRFTETTIEEEVHMQWEIELRPFPLARPVVERLTEMVASTITRNLQVRLAEPGAVVKIAPPRGYSGKALGSVPKDTWLGGVLDAHRFDQRSIAEQTFSLFQPWTWGRVTNDLVKFQWSDEEMPN